MKQLRSKVLGALCASFLLLSIQCATTQDTGLQTAKNEQKEELANDEDRSSDSGLEDEYLEEQRKNQKPAHIDQTGNDSSDAFVIPGDNADSDQPTKSEENTGPKANEDQSDPSKPEDRSEQNAVDNANKTEEQIRKEQEAAAEKARLEEERRRREEEQRKEEERKRKEAELQRQKNEATFYQEAFQDRIRTYEMALESFRISKLKEARDAKLPALDAHYNAFWKKESEDRFGAAPVFEIGANVIYVVALKDPLQYQSSRPVLQISPTAAVEWKDPLSVWQALQSRNGRWILMEKTAEGYVPLALQQNGNQYRVASIIVHSSGIVRLEIYSRSSSRRAGQYHILYPVEIKLMQKGGN